MKKRYLDNASTTFPKPAGVAQAVADYITNVGCNVSRGDYEAAYGAEELVFETREQIAQLFRAPDCRCVAFTKNVTESLNVLLKGFLKPGDHVLVSSMEHNAVMRPLVQLAKQGVSFSRVPCREDGTLILEQLPTLVQPNTRAVVMTHASNVCGTLLPLETVGEFCAARGLRFFVDCAQTAGVWDVSMDALHADAVAFTGHKGLLGPQGIGGFVIKEDLAAAIEPLLSGGTGSLSHTEDVPTFLPDRFEPGTLNLPGIAGLHASLTFLREKGIDTLRAHELSLTKRFLDGLSPLEKEGRLRILGLRDISGRTGVVSIQTLRRELAEVAFALDDTYGIMTRVGLHCAPSAHKTLGTYPTGTIRFSFGAFNTTEDVDAALDALCALC